MPERKGLVIFVEGETEVEFYEAMLQHLKTRCPNKKYPFDNVLPPKNMKGIGSFKDRVVRKFEKQVLRTYPDTKFTVVLAYDTDVFEFADKPHVDWKEVDKALTKAGATQVTHLPAKRSIEDWFLLDEEGVKRYLHLPNNTQLKGGTGLKKLEAAFKKSNKVYVKGTKVKGFVDALNVGLIASKLCRNLQPLCGVLSIDCHRDGCCINDYADK